MIDNKCINFGIVAFTHQLYWDRFVCGLFWFHNRHCAIERFDSIRRELFDEKLCEMIACESNTVRNESSNQMKTNNREWKSLWPIWFCSSLVFIMGIITYLRGTDLILFERWFIELFIHYSVVNHILSTLSVVSKTSPIFNIIPLNTKEESYTIIDHNTPVYCTHIATDNSPCDSLLFSKTKYKGGKFTWKLIIIIIILFN